MTYKEIGSFVASERELDLVLPSATRLTEQYDAHLSVVALGIDMIPAGGFYMGASPLLITDALVRAQQTAELLQARVSERLQGLPLRWATEAQIAPFGSVGGVVGLRARYTDLIVQASPYLEGLGPTQEAVLEAALFEGGAAALVLPATGLPKDFGRRVVFAWNQSNEAMRAARRALPLLIGADQVIVVVVDPPPHSPESADPGGMLCRWLARHGVRAEVTVLARTLPRVADLLVRALVDRDASLLVMGAYGHSRLREAIMGGVTRDVLRNMTHPVFLAH